MIYIIVYVLHYYVLPRRTFVGERCLEDLFQNITLWDKIFRTSAILDVLILGVVLCGICKSIKNIKLFCKNASSEEVG